MMKAPTTAFSGNDFYCTNNKYFNSSQTHLRDFVLAFPLLLQIKFTFLLSVKKIHKKAFKGT